MLGLDKPTKKASLDPQRLPFRGDRGTLELGVDRLQGSQEVQADGDEVDRYADMPGVRG